MKYFYVLLKLPHCEPCCTLECTTWNIAYSAQLTYDLWLSDIASRIPRHRPHKHVCTLFHGFDDKKRHRQNCKVFHNSDKHHNSPRCTRRLSSETWQSSRQSNPRLPRDVFCRSGRCSWCSVYGKGSDVFRNSSRQPRIEYSSLMKRTWASLL